MENEIQVGEYVRTKDGKIIKFDKFGTLRVGYTNPKYYKTIISNRRHYKYDNIVKHSPNLIDLIQCGDYVNGHLVIDIPGDGSGAVYLEQITKGALIPTLKEDIETIVTKEMMESISYKVKE